MMKANYHTHTARCGHAEGMDEEYVLAAIERGFDELGFSDHVPWPYKNGYVHPTVRMHISQMPEYLASVRALAEKYRGQIRILTGFECEYFPDYMGWLADMKAENGLDYLILGNHYDHDDEHGFYFGHTRTAEQIRRYVDSAVKGMETGMFVYLAHPDLFMRDYGRPLDADGRAAAKELCQACKALNMPMEYNLHDRFLSPITHRKSYPDADFFDIVRQEGVRVLIGLDAHEPEEIRNPAQWDRAMKELEPFGALREDHLEL